MTPSKFLVARASEHEAQNIPPHNRQWWRRRTTVNFAPHLVHDAASLSGCHVALALADAMSSLRVGMTLARGVASRPTWQERVAAPRDLVSVRSSKERRRSTGSLCARAQSTPSPPPRTTTANEASGTPQYVECATALLTPGTRGAALCPNLLRERGVQGVAIPYSLVRQRPAGKWVHGTVG